MGSENANARSAASVDASVDSSVNASVNANMNTDRDTEAVEAVEVAITQLSSTIVTVASVVGPFSIQMETIPMNGSRKALTTPMTEVGTAPAMTEHSTCDAQRILDSTN